MTTPPTRNNSPLLTKFEVEILDVLWRLGEASVREVWEALQDGRRPAYTTVATILGRLEEKDAVRRAGKVGKQLRFTPVVSRRSTYRRLIDELIDILGSPQPLLSHLIESRSLSLADLEALERALEAAVERTKREEEQ